MSAHHLATRTNVVALGTTALLVLTGCGSQTAQEPDAGLGPTHSARAKPSPTQDARVGLSVPAPLGPDTQPPVPRSTRPWHPTRDTLTLRALAAHRITTDHIRLRDGVLRFSLHPGKIPPTGAISLAAAVKATKAQGYAPPTFPITCRLGRLTDHETFRPTARGPHYLYVDKLVWMCVQLEVPDSGGVGPHRAANFVTFFAADTGEGLSTIQDGS